jgi:hypothetical protein
LLLKRRLVEISTIVSPVANRHEGGIYP